MMMSKQHTIILLLVCLLLPACVLGESDNSGGQWQGTVQSREGPRQERVHPFLVTNTGGEEAFGNPNGDIHDHLADVDFWTDQLGWACGYGGVFKTVDGGLTWRRMKPRGGWYHIRMTGPNKIWLLEGFWGQGKANLWHTVDGGKTWNVVLQGKTQGWNDLFCRGEERWILCGGYQSYFSHDDGATWNPIPFNGLINGALHLAIPGDAPTNEKGGFVAYVLGNWGPHLRLVKSVDGGENWKIVPIPEDFASLSYWPSAMFFSDSMHGWIGSGEGELLYTSDGGSTWQREHLPTKQSVCAIWFDRLGRGYVSALNNDMNHPMVSVYMSLNHGETWIPALEGHKQINAFCSLGGKLWGVGNEPANVPEDLVIITDNP